MLENVRIKGFRSCKDVSLRVDSPLIALLGRNGAGKTNILKGIDWLARTASALEPLRQDIPRHGSEETVGTIQMQLDGLVYEFSASWQAKFDASAPGRQKVTVNEGLKFRESATARWMPLFDRAGEEISLANATDVYRVAASASALPSLSALLPPDHSLLPQVQSILRFFGSIRYYPLEEPMDQTGGIQAYPLVFEDNYNQWRAGGAASDENQFHMELLRLHLEEQERFSELKSLLGEDGLGILQSFSIDKIPRPTEKAPLMYVIRMVPADSSADDFFGYPELSAGTRRLIRLLVALLCDDSSVMLVEQPEDSIHSGLTAKLLDLLRSYSEGRVVIMTTHASSMLNSLSPQAIRLVTMSRGVTELRPLTELEMEAAREFLENDGTLSDFVESVED